MNLKLCAVVSVLFALSAVSEGRVNILDIYRKEVFNYGVLRNKRPVIVYFTKPTCPPCNNLRRLLEVYAKEHSEDMDLALVDLEKYPELREEFEVKAIPTTRAFKKGNLEGEVKGPGWKSVKALADALIEQ